jgi:hypothetical protein
VQTRQLISKEKSDWRVSRLLMEDQVSLLEEEIALLGEKAEKAKAEIGDSDAKLAELEAGAARLREATAGLQERIRPLELRVLALLRSLPEPVQANLRPLSSRIPPPELAEADIRVGLAERFQNTMGILNQLNKVSREIHESNETRRLADGTSANVSVLYLGLAQGIYANPASGLSGQGHPRPDGSGWEWTERNEGSERINLVFSMHRNEALADFVALPTRVVEVRFSLSPPETLKEEAP